MAIGSLNVDYATNEPPTLTADQTTYKQNHLWINTVIGRAWILSDTAAPGTWINISGNRIFSGEPAADQSDSLVYGDLIKLLEFEFIWNGIDWVRADCCDNGPTEPPEEGLCSDGNPPFYNGNNWTCG